MNKVTIKGDAFELKGNAIEAGKVLEFKAIDREGKEVTNCCTTGIKVVSFFPDINTSVCDAQTVAIGKKAEEHKNVRFISITTDDVDTINKWCLSKGMDNIEIWSDKKLGEFGNKTNTVIPKIEKLARGFIILDDENKILEVSMKEELAVEPDYSVLDKYIK